MQGSSLNNKRIAKNAILLYVRTGLTLLIGLYTSRVVLNVLGVDDYGIYGVVGGIIGFMGFINSSMSGATSRFITYALGKNNYDELKSTFVSAFWVHCVIALLILFIAETVGLWFLYNKISIPEGRMDAAFWVYQLSVASSLVGITQVPYNACIISHENLNIYAYVEMVTTISKLLIVFLLIIVSTDKLILYALLYFLISLLTALFYRIYCIRNYKEAHLSFKCSRSIVLKMLSYSIWDLYGCFSVAAKSQGRTILLNIFFGVAINTAASLANTVVGMLMSFTSSVSQAFKPQIVLQYASGNIQKMETVAVNSMKYSLLLMSLMMIPLLFETNYIFTFWLGNVPNKVVEFCRLIIIASYIDIAVCTINYVIHASGKIKQLSFISGTFYWLVLPIIYLLFKFGFDAYWAFGLDIIMFCILFVLNLRIAKKHVPELSQYSFFRSFFVAVVSILPAIAVSAIIYYLLDESIFRLILITLFSCSFTCFITYVYVLDYDTKIKLNNFLSRKFGVNIK